jgi:D-alanine transaminase
MPRFAYVNGRYLPHRHAAVHIEDRGYQFADGVYEVIAVRGRHLVDIAPHLVRLGRSLGELGIPWPISEAGLCHVIGEVVRRNRVVDGMVYLQVTRGAAPREHAVPESAKPALVVTARPHSGPPPKLVAEGCAVITVPDIRWQRCDIKTIALIPNVLAKQQAREAGAFEALQVDGDGLVTEGAATNAWIVTGDGLLVTRPADHRILDGVTRRTVLAIAGVAGLDLEERPFSVDELASAAEAFLTATTTFVLPVVRVDGKPIGEGRPGPFTRRLMEAYTQFAAAPPDGPGLAVESGP